MTKYTDIFEQYEREINLFLVYMKDREYSKETQNGAKSSG